MERWTFLTNHSHVLLSIAQHPEIRLRDVAVQVGITERAAQRIVADLVEGGYLSITRVGRRNQYDIHPDFPFRHPLERHSTVRALLEQFVGPLPRSRKTQRQKAVPANHHALSSVPVP